MPVGRNISTSDQDHEGDDVGPLDADVRERRDQVLDDAEQQAADHGAADVADAAEHGGRERLDAGHEAHGVAEGEGGAEQEAGRAAERAADDEGARDGLVDVDAHERGGRRVLGDGADAAAELGPGDQPVEEDHHHDRRTDDDDLEQLDLRAVDA